MTKKVNSWFLNHDAKHSDSQLDHWREKCRTKADLLTSQILEGRLAMIDIIFSESQHSKIIAASEKIKLYKKILFLGVGGSSLGGKTLCSLNPKKADRIEFLESIDANTINLCFSKLVLKETFFVVISKSGETVETICQTLILIEEFGKQNITDFADQFLFITEKKDSSITNIANKINAPTVEHPAEIGGRYSCFSIVGLLPAILADLDIDKIRDGAKSALQNFHDNNDVVESCAIQLSLYEHGVTNSVIMPYVDRLKNFTDWYRQLWAESLGKNSFGSTPINSMGTIDQHSQLQLYLDGPKDKLFTFITLEEKEFDFAINDLEGVKTLFGNKKLSQIIEIEHSTTIETLSQNQNTIRIIKLDCLDEEVMGFLMMTFILETILIAYVKDINPFDQPAVELRKSLARKMLQ